MAGEIGHHVRREVIGGEDVGDHGVGGGRVGGDLSGGFFEGSVVGFSGSFRLSSTSLAWDAFSYWRVSSGERKVLLFALCTEISSQPHGNRTGNQLRQPTKDDDFGVVQRGQPGG